MAELNEAQRELVKAAVKETFLLLGVNLASPDDIQEAQKDFSHLRDWRIAVEQIQRRSLYAMAGTLITGLIAAIVLGVQTWIANIRPH